MELELTAAGVRDASRMAGIRVVLLTLRMMEHWRQSAGDYNTAMVLLAVIAVSSEKLTRTSIDDRIKDIRAPIDEDSLAPCNISSIASATGFNRETTRRYVGKLIAVGILVRTPKGSVRLSPGYIQQPSHVALLAAQLEAVTKAANGLIKDGVLQVAGYDAR